MLLLDNIHPESSIYYNGSIVLEELNKRNIIEMIDLCQQVKQRNNMSFSTLILCLDWLYLIDVATVNGEEKVVLCSSKA